jgi:glycerol-3-phosphate dehydrogenase subunit B
MDWNWSNKMPAIKKTACDLLVIGSGIAGMAAAMFAAHRQIETSQVGITGEINFASGLLDVLGIHPLEKGTRWDDPWAGIRKLTADEQNHPYARLGIAQIRTAVEACVAFLGDAGVPYTTRGAMNSRVLTPAGTIKTTYAVPLSMAAGAEALENRTPTLLVDFQGLKGFSARQIIETMGDRWPGLRRVRLTYPGTNGELYTEHMARQLDLAVHRRQLADLIRPHVGRVKAVGLPAVLGMYNTSAAVTDLERQLGVPVFEIPTMVPSITGLRLREAFEQQLPAKGVNTFYQQKVLDAMVLPDGRFRFTVGNESPNLQILARGAILASGRFFGKGLCADRDRIREAIFDLPVTQPAGRSLWHHRDLLQPAGHPVNRAGLETDESFRPIDKNGQVIHAHLHAAGSILAHQDWIRQKCGSGLSIATAYAAVRAFANDLNK